MQSRNIRSFFVPKPKGEDGHLNPPSPFYQLTFSVTLFYLFLRRQSRHLPKVRTLKKFRQFFFDRQMDRPLSFIPFQGSIILLLEKKSAQGREFKVYKEKEEKRKRNKLRKNWNLFDFRSDPYSRKRIRGSGSIRIRWSGSETLLKTKK